MNCPKAGSFLLVAMLSLVAVIPIPLAQASANPQTTQPSACAQGELASTNADSLVALARNNPTFQQLAAGEAYNFQALGIQAGLICSPLLMLTNARHASIEVIFSPDNSVAKVLYFPPSNLTMTAKKSAVWSGYQSYRCQTSGSQCNAVTMSSAQADFHVLSNTPPTSNENGNCCINGQWVGIGDQVNASDNVGLQGGTIITAAYQSGATGSYGSPTFWYQLFSQTGANFFSSTCLYLNYGDYVNVTASRGTFTSGGNTYTAKITYGDNDPSSTCSVIIFFGGSGYTFNAYWAYYELETPAYSGCSYSETLGGITYNDICQSVQFVTSTYTAGNYYSGFGWSGFATAPSGYAYSVVGSYIYQGTQDTSVSIVYNSNTQFYSSWISSQQI